jgi:hypothetical protein
MLARPKKKVFVKYFRTGKIFGVIPRKHGVLEDDYIILYKEREGFQRI